MAARYPEHENFIIVDAEKSAEGLNRQVWQHAAAAEARGLAPIVELWARSSTLSRSLDAWWRAGGELVEDTLQGVYLIRVNLVTFGPEAVLKLTPFALAGVPLFLGWNPTGQVLTAKQFAGQAPADLAQALSAFVEDVIAGKPHSLNPSPKVGSARWDARLSQFRRDWQRLSRDWKQQLAATGTPVRGLSAAAPEQSSPTSSSVTPEPEAVVNVPASSTGTGETQGSPAPSAAPAPAPRHGSWHENLAGNLRRARELIADFAVAEQLDLDYSFESLVALDHFLDAGDGQALTLRARELIPVFGVYLGDTIAQVRGAEWSFDASETSPIEGLKLTIAGPTSTRVAPVALVLELATDRSRSLYGCAVALCADP